jgi:hypothetical protein
MYFGAIITVRPSVITKQGGLLFSRVDISGANSCMPWSRNITRTNSPTEN